ncbi:MATE family efflux transporter [Limosilactobacillus reuteri]|uniref:oligosaccharide flippase family protein n=2 Tax=Limosilactobacillus reuteri TaxID=1598 RepID=UPI0011465129|nr:oligosaccharide flippase family protein [Limosilactobacillus reuteri]
MSGLFIPKLMGVVQYGYYKIFILYTVYAALLHFGFTDGVLLHYGGVPLNKINKKKLRAISKFFIFFQLIISILLILSSQFIPIKVYRVIFTFIGCYSFIFNLFTYFQFINQAVMNFDFLAKMNIVQALFTSCSVVVLFILIKLKYLNKLNYYIYILFFISNYVILLFIYILKYKDIIFGDRFTFRQVFPTVVNFFRIGIPVTLSYQIANLILNLDNQFISFFFSTEVFGVYSFSYSLISLTTTVVTAISTVLFPYLNKIDTEKALGQYVVNVGYILIIIYSALLIYYPVHIFVHWFLPEYVPSLVYFRLLLPGVGISSCISLIIFNYYKILNESKKYLVFGIIVLGGAILINYIVYRLFKNPYLIALASLFILFLWYFLDNEYIHIKYKLKKDNNTFYMLTMIFIFEVTTQLQNYILSFIIYFSLYIITTYIFEKNICKNMIIQIKSKL